MMQKYRIGRFLPSRSAIGAASSAPNKLPMLNFFITPVSISLRQWGGLDLTMLTITPERMVLK
jgi:hypothetical protein